MQQNLAVRILEILDQRERSDGYLPEHIELYRNVLLVQHEVKTSLDLPKLSNRTAKERLSLGIPLIDFDDLGIAPSGLSDLFDRIDLIIEERLALSDNDMGWLKNMASDSTLLYKTARDWYEDTEYEIKYPGVDSEVLDTTMQAILWPWLRTAAEFLIDEVDTNSWRKPYCPICAGKPDFAFLAADDGSRWLSCFRCDSEWSFQRLECPYCGNMEQKQLSVFTDDPGEYRVYICHNCHTYLKAIDLRKTNGDVLIPLEKVKTFDLSWEDQDSFRPGWL